MGKIKGEKGEKRKKDERRKSKNGHEWGKRREEREKGTMSRPLMSNGTLIDN